MTVKRLYLAHHHTSAPEVHVLADELRVHGVAPWVDKEGGFKIGDHSPDEARRTIREDCFGLLLYATGPAFDSDFIRDIEISEALRQRERDENFTLFAVPRNMSFTDLRNLSIGKFGHDLSLFHTVAIPDGKEFAGSFRRVAVDVVERLLRRPAAARPTSLTLQFSTRELLPDAADDLLCINAIPLLGASIDEPSAWDRLLLGLRDIKACIAASLGRPRLCIHGSKHLTAAFMFGRVFAPFEMHIRQTPSAIWSTHAAVTESPLLAVDLAEASGTGPVFVEIASGRKDIVTGVDAYIQKHGVKPAVRLQLYPQGRQALDLDNSLCLAMAKQAYTQLERIMRGRLVDGVHIFAAVPQAFMMMFGRMFSGMPVTHLYEWTGTDYVYACGVPAGPL